jgi:hypothetical protein
MTRSEHVASPSGSSVVILQKDSDHLTRQHHSTLKAFHRNMPSNDGLHRKHPQMRSRQQHKKCGKQSLSPKRQASIPRGCPARVSHECNAAPKSLTPIYVSKAPTRHACPEDFGSPSPDKKSSCQQTPSSLHYLTNGRYQRQPPEKEVKRHHHVHEVRPSKRQRVEVASTADGILKNQPITEHTRELTAVTIEKDIPEVKTTGPYNLRSRQQRCLPQYLRNSPVVDASWRQNKKNSLTVESRKSNKATGELHSPKLFVVLPCAQMASRSHYSTLTRALFCRSTE